MRVSSWRMLNSDLRAEGDVGPAGTKIVNLELWIVSARIEWDVPLVAPRSASQNSPGLSLPI